MPRLTQAPWPAALRIEANLAGGHAGQRRRLAGGCAGTPTCSSSSPPPQQLGRATGSDASAPAAQGRPDPAAVGAAAMPASPRQSMKNAAEMALAEFNDAQYPTPGQGRRRHAAGGAARRATGARRRRRNHRRAAVRAIGQRRRRRSRAPATFRSSRSRPTPMSPAHGVYLLSFLPESDVDRIVDYATSTRQAFVRGAAAGQCLWLGGRGRVPAGRSRAAAAAFVALEHYPHDPAAMAGAGHAMSRRRAGRADCDLHSRRRRCRAEVVQALAANGVNTKRIQLLGTGLWDDPRIFSIAALDGGWYAAPDSAGFRNFAGRYRARYGQDPVRTATLAYDAVALVAALVKTQGPAALHDEVLTNSSGFAGIDGLFRFRPDGTNERGLAVLRVTPPAAAGHRPAAARRSANRRREAEITPPDPPPPHRAPGSPRCVTRSRPSRRRFDRAVLAQRWRCASGRAARPAIAAKRCGSMPSARRSPISRNSSALRSALQLSRRW